MDTAERLAGKAVGISKSIGGNAVSAANCAVDYLRKPLRMDSLLEIAERYCRPVFLN